MQIIKVFEKRRKTIAEFMVEVLMEYNCDGVMYGDLGLLDECASRCKHTNLMDLHPLTRHQRILGTLEKRPDLFKKFFVKLPGIGGPLIRGFDLVKNA